MRVAVAGTFGPIHDGHRALFRKALAVGDDGVVVGLTTDAFATASRRARGNHRSIPPVETRERAVREELVDLDEWGRDVTLRRIDDEVGFAVSDADIDTLVVSPETVDELTSINRRRRERGLDPLCGLVVPYVLADDGERISSTRLSRGEIDEHGTVLDADTQPRR